MDGEYLDIHNCYVLTEIERLTEDRSARLVFERDLGDWVSSDAPSKAELAFLEVEYFEVNDDLFPKLPISIEEIGYNRATDFDHLWLMSGQEASEKDHLVIRMDGDQILRIFAAQAKLAIFE